MDLIEIEESRAIHDVVWTYNLCSKTLSEEIWNKAEKILTDLLDKIISQRNTVKEQQVKEFYSHTVLELERLFGDSPLDDNGIYEYGGLNCFFAEIMESLNFEVKKGKFYLISDFVYGKDLEES